MSETSTRLRLRVSPGSGRAGFVGRHGDAWKVRVTAVPEDGRANEAVIGLLAEALGLPRASIGLVSGAAGRDKLVRIARHSLDDVRALLDRRLAGVPT